MTEFEEYCYKSLDGLYDPLFPEKDQSSGYTLLKLTLEQNITPATKEEVNKWYADPDARPYKDFLAYLQFLHPVLRNYVRDNWDIIKNLKR